MPLAPAVIDNHGALLLALHAQPAPLVTVMLPVPPCAGTLADVGSIVDVQPLPCDTVTVCPAMVSMAERGPPGVAAAVNCTVPLPAPLAPAVMDSQGALLLALQAQSAPVVTLMLPLPPVAAMLVLVGVTANAQPLPWVIVMSVRPTLIVPVRAAPVSGATVKAIVPLPLPEVGPVNVIHAALLPALQGHPPSASIRAEPLPPADEKGCDRGPTEMLHPAPCEIVTDCPATSTVPVRDGPDVASTTSRTVPGPVPDAPCGTVIHGTLLIAVQGHALPVVTAIVVEPPAAPGA